jgi:hypothetical protein
VAFPSPKGQGTRARRSASSASLMSWRPRSLIAGRAGPVGEAGLDGLRPLGGVPDHDQRPLEYRAFLLDAARVRDQQAGVAG